MWGHGETFAKTRRDFRRDEVLKRRFTYRERGYYLLPPRPRV